MTLENLLKILLASGSLTAGSFLTALRSKLSISRKKNYLHVIFYILSAVVILGVVITFVIHKDEIVKPDNYDWYAITVLTIALIFSILLIWSTKKFLIGKHQFKSKELDPVVNKFSNDADKHNIKLLAGNLDFFGTSEQQIDCHPQYKGLREAAFRHIQVICTPPVTNGDKMRYGKIITDFPIIEMKYYQPSTADLKVRGRIKTLNNVTRLLIYNKVSTGVYEALELNTAETDGARYGHLWTLIWELAVAPTNEQLNEYKSLYRP